MFPNGFAPLVNAGERYANEVGIKQIAASDNGNIFGNSQPRIEDGAHGSYRDGIVVTKDSVGARRIRKELGRNLVGRTFSAIVARRSYREDVLRKRSHLVQ